MWYKAAGNWLAPLLVGWNDKALLAIFENGHYAADQEYFYESNSKKTVYLGARAQSFHFQITGILTI